MNEKDGGRKCDKDESERKNMTEDINAIRMKVGERKSHEDK